MSAENRFHRIAKSCAVIAVLLLAFAALGPGEWMPRTGLGFELEHFLALFVVTSIVCLAWPRPLVVGGLLIVIAVLLEGLQALTPDRLPNLFGAIYSAGGALAAALLAEVFIRTRRWLARGLQSARHSK